MSHSHGIDDDICPECNKPYDGFGHATNLCICPREIPHTPPSPSPPVMLTAEDWLALNAKRVAGEAEAHVAAFMRQIQDGLNPWGDQKDRRLEGEPVQMAVAESICVQLTQFGFVSAKKLASPNAASQNYSLWYVIVSKPVPK